jgi:hypothetical protein
MISKAWRSFNKVDKYEAFSNETEGRKTEDKRNRDLRLETRVRKRIDHMTVTRLNMSVMRKYKLYL